MTGQGSVAATLMHGEHPEAEAQHEIAGQTWPLAPSGCPAEVAVVEAGASVPAPSLEAAPPSTAPAEAAVAAPAPTAAASVPANSAALRPGVCTALPRSSI